jgi:hypothetical protein
MSECDHNVGKYCPECGAKLNSDTDPDVAFLRDFAREMCVTNYPQHERHLREIALRIEKLLRMRKECRCR